MFSQEIKLHGHIIDSLILPKVLDEILSRGGMFTILEIEVGQKRTIKVARESRCPVRHLRRSMNWWDTCASMERNWWMNPKRSWRKPLLMEFFQRTSIAQLSRSFWRAADPIRCSGLTGDLRLEALQFLPFEPNFVLAGDSNESEVQQPGSSSGKLETKDSQKLPSIERGSKGESGSKNVLKDTWWQRSL
jgi:hypothetical protein